MLYRAGARSKGDPARSGGQRERGWQQSPGSLGSGPKRGYTHPGCVAPCRQAAFLPLPGLRARETARSKWPPSQALKAGCPGAHEPLYHTIASYLKMWGSSLEDLREQPCAILGGREFQRTETFLEIRCAMGWADLLTSAGENLDSPGYEEAARRAGHTGPVCPGRWWAPDCLPTSSDFQGSRLWKILLPFLHAATPFPAPKERKKEGICSWFFFLNFT